MEDYDLIEFWRDMLEPKHCVMIPRVIGDMPLEYTQKMSKNALAFDYIELTKEHLDQMTNRQALEWIESQYHQVQ